MEQPRDYYFNAYFNKFNFTHLFHKNKIDSLISFIHPSSSVLDAGCGSGVFLYLLKKYHNCKVTGVDIREDQIKFAQEVCQCPNFFQADLKTFNLNQKFDFVNCSDVIEHFQKDTREEVLINLVNHVSPKGYLIIAFPSKFYITVLEKIWKLLRKIIYPDTHFDDDDIHMVVNTADICNSIANCGMKLKKKTWSNLGLITILIFENIK